MTRIRLIPNLEGYAFVMGPIPSGDGAPIFNGDGALMRFSTQDGGMSVKTRRLLTYPIMLTILPLNLFCGGFFLMMLCALFVLSGRLICK